MNVSGLWDELCLAVCRPPRDDAYRDVALVGGRRATFKLPQGKFYRQDVVLVSIMLLNGTGEELARAHLELTLALPGASRGQWKASCPCAGPLSSCWWPMLECPALPAPGWPALAAGERPRHAPAV